MGRALARYLDWLHESRKHPTALSVATGYFNPGAFFLLADHLERLESFRLLLGAEPKDRDRIAWPQPGEPTGNRYDEERIKRALTADESDLARDRDLLGFSLELDENLGRLIAFLRSEKATKVEVRRYEDRFLHGKAFLFANEDGVVAGSSNFTPGGLAGNLELNLGHYQPGVMKNVADWFEELWEESVPYDLASLYEARFRPYDPHLIYLRILWERYGKEVEEERKGEAPIPLATFQNDGIFRAERILDVHHGVLIADGVGLGKTYIAGELLRRAIQERRQRTLVICPAALRDGMWASFQDRHQLYFETVSYEQIAGEERLGGNGGQLRHEPDEYALVVIDEAHAFRNPSTKRAQALRLLLRGETPKDLVLMTATPVNNSLWDLYYLLSYFVGHDAVFAGAGIPSLRERFKEAQLHDPYKLTPNILFDVLDATTVRRTRHFIVKEYPGETIPGPDGKPRRIRFPEPHPRKVDYELTAALDAFFDAFAKQVSPDEGEPSLTLARYQPSKYRRGAERVEAHQLALTGLIRTALLKRFESSVHAFQKTVDRMIRHNQAFLEALQLGYVPQPEAIEDWSPVDSDEAYEELLRESESEDASGYDVKALRSDVLADQAILGAWLDAVRPIRKDDDPKLKALVDTLRRIVREAEEEGVEEPDIRQKRKVVVFSFYEDTVDWIQEYLNEIIEKDDELACYRGRIASVSGEESRDGVSRTDAVYGFAPISMEAPPAKQADRFEILISTDVLAEGGNLQQCRNVINYDLPWNPMRVVQRNGRVDRLLSPHDHVFAYCFFPVAKLEAMLELELRVRRKLAQAAATIGVESEVIPGVQTVEINFAETRDQIQKLLEEESEFLRSGGEDASVYSSEEFRQELRRGLNERRGEILSLPWAAGSGLLKGERTGHVFCARVGEHMHLRFVPLDKEEPMVSDTLTCLKLASCDRDAERHLPEALRTQVYAAWERAREDIYKAWEYQTDPKNIEPRVRPLFKRVAEHLREHPPKALTQEQLEEVIESIEAPWGIRYERELRSILEDTELTVLDKSDQLSRKIKELGMRPFRAPEPLPKIEEDQIKLVCWLAIESE